MDPSFPGHRRRARGGRRLVPMQRVVRQDTVGLTESARHSARPPLRLEREVADGRDVRRSGHGSGLQVLALTGGLTADRVHLTREHPTRQIWADVRPEFGHLASLNEIATS